MSEQNFTSRELRDALGRFATGVCLVTLIDGEGRPRALTVNSFSSLSLDPPLVLWSLQNDSEAYALYADAPRYAISVLSREQEALSSRYALKGAHALDSAHYLPGVNGAPLIKGALISFECTLTQTVEGGDHRILIGRVDRVTDAVEEEPLLFFGGRYRQLQ